MKKKFKMQELDCADCARKMEDLIKKIPGVNDASISFMLQKLTIDADDERFDEIMIEAQQAVSKIDDCCKILTSGEKREKKEKKSGCHCCD